MLLGEAGAFMVTELPEKAPVCPLLSDPNASVTFIAPVLPLDTLLFTFNMILPSSWDVTPVISSHLYVNVTVSALGCPAEVLSTLTCSNSKKAEEN
ncbi:MAG: hypothetical protein ACOYJR_03480 [Acutalibacteraceae bacterium]